MIELLNILKSKYNYDEELLNFLKIIIPNMIEYFGEEYKDKIILTFIETPIIITKNTMGGEIKDEDPNLLLAGGAYCYEVNIENNNPKIIGKIIIPNNRFKPFNFNNIKDIGKLVHELCHAVKSGLTINNLQNDITHHIGLVQSKGIIENNNFSIKSSNNARGLEEALNAIDETMIMQKLYPNYELTNEYSRLASYIWPMINENHIFFNKIRNSQFLGNNDWQDYLGIETSNKLIELCNKHYELMVNRLFELIRNENLQQELDNIEKELIYIIEMTKEYSKNKNCK